jgi:transposase
MRAYSQDLRERVLQAYDAGDGGYVTLSRRFRVAESTVYRWVRECRQEGKRAPKVYRHGFVSVLDDDDGAVLRRLVEEQPDTTLAEYATRFEARTGWAVSLSSVCRALKRWRLKRKRKSVRASEQQRPDVAAKRVAYQASIQAVDPTSLLTQSIGEGVISRCAGKRDIEFRRCSWRSAVGVVGIRTVMPGVSNELGGRRVRGCLVWG